MLQSKSRTWVEIDLRIVKQNYQWIKQHVADTKIMAVVKANAYGHGDVEVAHTLQEEGVDFFAVSSIDEALRLRKAKIRENILILGYTPQEHFHYLIENDIVQCIMSLDYARVLANYAKQNQTKIRTHIKVDTGMGRLGIPYVKGDDHFEDICEVYQIKDLRIEGIFSHFSVADMFMREDDVAFTTLQLKRFQEVLQRLKARNIAYGLTHIQNSYGVLNYPELTFDYCRPGIILLGNTSDDAIPLQTTSLLQPSLTWKANVSQVKKVRAHNYVGYGRNFQAKKDMKVATISCGYADGLHRQASLHHFQILVNGVKCEVIGNICMDQCMVDVSAVENVEEGDVVVLVGQQGGNVIAIDQLSRCSRTINNESFCLISYRVPRFYR
ncbi:MAG: alanine racemase [Breznakia sp.]